MLFGTVFFAELINIVYFFQIMTEKYLVDPGISFCGIGDAFDDRAPLQICEFSSGAELDDLITKVAHIKE